MSRHLPLVIRFITMICLVTSALAQDQPALQVQRAAPTVTAVAAGDRLRFTAPSSVVQIHLEVYNSTAKKVFDNEVRGGNVLDWFLQDGQAERLADGAYLCAVTVKSLSGKITQRIGSIIIEQGAASVRAVAASQMTTQQAEAIGPLEADAALVILQADERPTTTILAHNGEEGQITRGRGALSFRLGDFYGGKDTEQMRLTQEGNLGIGIAQPQARLDVDGFVRASQGIVFPDGSVQFSASRKTFGPPSQRPGQFQQKGTAGQEHLLPDIGGTGTTGKIAKWIDGPNGVLGDSLITEANNNIGINTTPDPRFKLDVLGYNRFRAPNASFYLSGFKPGGNDWVFQTVDDNGRFRIWGGDNATGAERLAIMLDTGFVGLGTGTPISPLHIAAPAPVLRLQDSDNPGAGQVGTVSFLNGAGAETGWVGFGASANANATFMNNRSGGTTSLGAGGVERLTVTSNGSVGIATTAPQEKLDVRGNIKLGSSGQLFAPGGEENLRIIRGSVDANGNILAGTGFQVSHNETGRYLILFDTPFSGKPTVATSSGCCEDNSVLHITVTADVQQSSSFWIYTVRSETFLHSYPFHFIAVGPR